MTHRIFHIFRLYKSRQVLSSSYTLHHSASLLTQTIIPSYPTIDVSSSSPRHSTIPCFTPRLSLILNTQPQQIHYPNLTMKTTTFTSLILLILPSTIAHTDTITATSINAAQATEAYAGMTSWFRESGASLLSRYTEVSKSLPNIPKPTWTAIPPTYIDQMVENFSDVRHHLNLVALMDDDGFPTHDVAKYEKKIADVKIDAINDATDEK